MINFKNISSDKDELLRAYKKTDIILKNLIESPKNVVIFALDHEYRYLLFNQAHKQTMKQIWGVDIEFGKNMLNYIKDPADRLKAKANFDRALSGESFCIEEEYGDIEKERRSYEDNYNPIIDEHGEVGGISIILTDITDRKRIENERNNLIHKLQEALEKVKVLSGLLPVCSNCKKIRDDKGYWSQIDSYLEEHSDATVTHGLCPECLEKLYGDQEWYIKGKEKK